jgi:glycosyltransferase involved in cell wall biosynthesis
MEVTVTLGHPYFRDSEGAVWTLSNLDHGFWQRYLQVFESANIITRVRSVTEIPDGVRRVDGPGVRVSDVVPFQGPWGYVKHRAQVLKDVQRAIPVDDAIMLRVPGQLASNVESLIRPTNRPYGVEVVGDSYESLSSAALQHPLQPFFQWWNTRGQQRQISRSQAVAYVTQNALQRRYPPSTDAFSTHYSSIDLGDEAFTSTDERAFSSAPPYTLVFVGSLQLSVKGLDVLLGAMSEAKNLEGLPLRLFVLGDGERRGAYEEQTKALQLVEDVTFLGKVSAGEPVRAIMDRADLMIHPSRSEGLPRAVIEAMARGLPCIASAVGGIPELLPAEDLVTPGDPHALARKIHEVVGNPERLRTMSSRNRLKAEEYHANVLQERRNALYRHLKDETARWLANR